jgi:hypothetical protein
MADDFSPVMKAVTGHYKSLKIKQIIVPEWGDETTGPLVIYAKPLTVGIRDRIYKEAVKSNAMLHVEALIALAMKSDGSPIFTVADRPILIRSADPYVVERIGAELLSPATTEDDLIKN